MSDDADVVKAVVQGTVEGVLAPFADLIRKLAGPGAEELRKTVRDSVIAYRMKRKVRLFQKTQDILHKLGGEPRVVPLKVLQPQESPDDSCSI